MTLVDFDASRLQQHAHWLDCVHGPNPAGASDQLRLNIVRALESGEPGTSLPPAWQVETDERLSHGDESAEGVWLYALSEYTATGLISEPLASQLDASHEGLRRAAQDVYFESIDAMQPLRECFGRNCTYDDDLPYLTIMCRYRGPLSREDVCDKLAEALDPIGFSWSLDYEQREQLSHRFITLGSEGRLFHEPLSRTLFLTDPPYGARPPADNKTWTEFDYASLEMHIAAQMSAKDLAVLGSTPAAFERLRAWGRAQATEAERDFWTAAPESPDAQTPKPEDRAARVSVDTLLSLSPRGL